MNVLVIAKKEFRQAIRSRAVVALTVLFALFTMGGAYLVSLIPALEGPGGGRVGVSIVYGLVSPASILVPVIGLLVGYRAIAGERESGSLNCLLGLPHTRRDVVLGNVVGRGAVITVSILVGFAFGIVVVAVLSESFSPLQYIAFTAATILFGLTFLSLAVGLSAATDSTSRAAWGAFGLFVLFQFLWGLLGMGVRYGTTGSVLPTPPLSDGYLLFTLLNPQRAYSAMMSSLLPSAAPLNAAFVMTRTAGGDLPFFYNGAFAFGVLVFWGVVPLLLGYRRFRRAELT